MSLFVQVQYGIFPDDFSFNLLIDSYIKDGDFKSKFLGFFLNKVNFYKCTANISKAIETRS